MSHNFKTPLFPHIDPYGMKGAVHDPVSAAIAVASAGATTLASGAIVAGSSSFFLGTAFGSFLVRAAVGLALAALAPKPPSLSNQGRRGYTVNRRGSALDHQIIYGKVRTGGVIVYDETTGTDNKFLHRVIAYAGHEVEAFDELYINDAKVTGIDTDGNVTEVTNPDGTTSSRYDGFVRINEHLGASDQAADSDLVAESSNWTAQHRLRGIAYLYIRLKFSSDVFPNGVPSVTATIKGKKVYDPRSDTTAWSDNPALCIRDYLTNGYGLDEATANVDDTLFQVAANVCDETDTLAGDTRYTCNGAFTTAQTPYDVLGDMLTSLGGTLWYAQGKWRIKAAKWTTPVLTLTEDDLRGPVSLSTRHSRRDNYNTVRGTFRGEETNWQVTDYPEVTNSAFLSADNDQEAVVDLDLPFTDTSVEARRLARISLERNRQQLTVQAPFGLRAFQVQVGDNVRLSNTRFGWNQKEFEVVQWTFGLTDDLDLQCQMTLRETAESVFDEVDDGEVYERDNTTLPSPFITVAPENLTVSDGGFTTEDGTFVNSFIVDWDAPDDAFVDYYELEWRVQGDSTFKGTSLRSTEYQIAPILESQTYEVRVKAINTFGVSGPYATTIASVGGDSTAPNLPTAITATGGFKYITIDWTNPPESDLNYVEIWENTSNTTSGATLVGESSGNQFVRTNLGLDVTRYYFLRSVDYSGNTSGYTTGVSGTTTYLDDPDFENGIRTLFEDQGLYPIEDVSGLPASGSTGQKVFNRSDGKLYEWNGSSWVLVVASVEAPDISGELQTNQIALDAVTSALIANDAVQSENIANLAVNEAKIADSAITTTKIANAAVESGNLANDAATEAKIATNAITETKIVDNAITTPKISAGAVTAGEIAAGSITTGKIAAGAVTASEIAAGSITSNEIATNSITAGNIAAGAITTSELAAGAVTATEISAGSITTDKIAADAVTTNEIAAGSITSNEIATNTITANEISTGAITASEISGNTITGDKIVANTITGGLLATSGIITNSAQINNAVVTNAKIANLAVDTAKLANAAVDTAKIADAAIETAKIGDLQVDTIKVKDRAITQQTSAQSAGGTNSTASYTTEGTLSFSASSGEQVLVGAFFDFEVDNTDPNDSQSGQYRVLFNGSQIDSGSLTAPFAETEADQIGIVSSETTTSGTNTLQVQIKCGSSTQMSVSATDINLFSLEALK